MSEVLNMSLDVASISGILKELVDQLVSERVEERLEEINFEKEQLRKQQWWTDEQIAEGFGKSYLEAQRLIRLMSDDPVGRQYISKDGGRSTRADVFEKWLMWHEQNRYSRGRKSAFKV